MSISSEITRLSGNVSAALTAIAAKGVTVPSGSNSDDLATLIAQISGGGGGSITVIETPDSHGGTIIEITAEAVKLQAKANISPTESSQTIQPDTGYTGLSTVQINAIPSNYVGSGITQQAAQTIHPSTSDQTISSGTYTTGTQTIKAVTIENLSASNIKKDVVVKIGDSTDDDCVTSITGTYEGSGGGGATVGTATNTPTTNVTSISFAVSGNPILFVVQMDKNNSYINGSSSRYITSAANNGSTVYTTALYKSGSTAREYTYSTSSWSYSNGTLTITSAGGSTAGYFTTSEYRLIYAY